MSRVGWAVQEESLPGWGCQGAQQDWATTTQLLYCLWPAPPVSCSTVFGQGPTSQQLAPENKLGQTSSEKFQVFNFVQVVVFCIENHTCKAVQMFRASQIQEEKEEKVRQKI